MRSPFLLIFVWLTLVVPTSAAVTIQLDGAKDPVVISTVYQRDGIVFLPLREILLPLQLSGFWDGAKRLYRIKTASGEIIVAPGTRQLRYREKVRRLKESPRIFAGELCVPEEVVIDHLPALLGVKVNYVNQDPGGKQSPPAKSSWFQPQKKDLPSLLVVIDPGHGGDDPGAISPDGVMEKDLTLSLALRTERILKREGNTPVLLLRNGDYGVTTRQRRNMILSAAEESLLISLHIGAWRSSETRGCTLYLLPRDQQDQGETDEPLLLAESLVDRLSGAGMSQCPVERLPLLPLTGISSPAVLIEVGYLTNTDELLILNNQESQERIAAALADGIKKYAAERLRRMIDAQAPQ